MKALRNQGFSASQIRVDNKLTTIFRINLKNCNAV